MAFNYFTALNLDRDKVRFRIGDTLADKGPRPDGRNYSDEEVSFVVTDEGSVNGAIAHFFEILANEWAQAATNEREGDASIDATEVSERYEKRAAIWRKKPGNPDANRSSGLVEMTRDDAYSDAAATEFT